MLIRKSTIFIHKKYRRNLSMTLRSKKLYFLLIIGTKKPLSHITGRKRLPQQYFQYTTGYQSRQYFSLAPFIYSMIKPRMYYFHNKLV